jgi:PKD repeat protein
MSEASAPAKPSVAKKGLGVLKLAFGGAAGLATGVIGVYATAVVDKVAKPPKPVANFSATPDGLTITCDNLASGQTGWWDFGDGSPLEPFNPDEKQVPHTYAKPGNYTVKLVVRNFLNEENDRTVGVDVTTTPKSGEGPAVAKLSVEPIGTGTAPATFRVKCELKNAQNMLLDPGTAQLPPEWLPSGGGAFERLVVYEQPGVYPLQVFAMSGAKVDKQWKAVEVKAPPAGALSAVAKVTDGGTKVERRTKPSTVAVRVPEKPAGGFERVLLADAGFTVADAKPGTVTSKAVKNVKVEVAADKKTAKVSGEWTGTADATNKAAGGSDVMIPLTLTLERSLPYTGSTQTVAAPLAFAGSFSPTSDDWTSGAMAVTLKLPDLPAGVVNGQRKVSLDLHEMGVTADRRLQDKVVLTLKELTKPAEEYAVTLSNGEKRVVRVERVQTGDVKVTVRPQTGSGARASK